MSATQTSHTELNAMQVSLLRLFNRPMSEDEVRTLKQLLVKYYSDLLGEEVAKVVLEKGYEQKDFDDMLNSED